MAWQQAGAAARRGGSAVDVDGVSVGIIPSRRERVPEPVRGYRSGVPAPPSGEGDSTPAPADTERSCLWCAGNVMEDAETPFLVLFDSPF